MPIFIQGLLDIPTQKANESGFISSLPYGGDETKLARMMSSKMSQAHFRARQVSLGIILSLARKGKWSTTLIINRERHEEGEIILSGGKVVRVFLKNIALQEEAAMRFLYQNDLSWYIDSQSASGEIPIIEKKKNILLVDNDEGILSLYKEIFSTEKTKVITARNGLEAIQILRENSISLLITDIKMPKMNGIELLIYMNKNFPEIPRIVITGYSTPQMELEFSERGISLLKKPIPVETIKEVVKKALQDGPISKCIGIPVYNFLQLIEMEQMTGVMSVHGKKNRLFLLL